MRGLGPRAVISPAGARRERSPVRCWGVSKLVMSVLPALSGQPASPSGGPGGALLIWTVGAGRGARHRSKGCVRGESSPGPWPGRASLAASKEVAAAVVLPEQAERAGAGHGLGAVGRAELAQDVADVF